METKVFFAKSPLVFLALVFALGIVLGRYLVPDCRFWLILAFISLLGLFFAASPKLQGIFLICAVLFMGAFWLGLSHVQESKCVSLSRQRVRGEGTVLSYPRMSGNNLTLIMKVGSLASEEGDVLTDLKVLLKIRFKEGLTILPGEHLRFSGVLDLPAESRNPGQFNYREYLACQGVLCQVTCEHDGISSSGGLGLRYLAARGREKVAEKLEVLPEREQGLLMGLLFGDTTMISPEEMESYQRAGVVHLFAVSGFNVVFVLAVAWFLLGQFRPGPVARLLWAIPILCGYYYLVGWTSSIVRASLMAFLALLSLALGKKNDVYTSLSVSFLVILLVNPGELFLAGFQLSFLTTLGIVYMAPCLEKYGLGKTAGVVLSAQLFSMPLIAFYFYQVSLVAVFLNALAALVSGAVTVLGLAGSILVWVMPVLATPLFVVAGFIMYYLSEFILWWGCKSWAALQVAAPSPFLLAGIYLFLLVLPLLLRFPVHARRLLFWSKKALPWVLPLLLAIIWVADQPEMEVVFLDVGQGDSIFLKTPRGKIMLIDGGGSPYSSYPVGKMTVSPYLRFRGVRKIDLLLLTHNHLDHLEGLTEIIPEYRIGILIMPPKELGNAQEEKLLEMCRKQGIAVREAVAGQKINLDEGVKVEVLNPWANDDSQGNNHSLMLRIVYGQTGWLLTGDAENQALNRLLEQKVPLRADILKIPHHGSSTSYNEAFYEMVNPETAVVSVGVNSFKLPHPKVMEYFRQEKIPLYSTWENGAIVTVSDGRNLTVRPWIRQ